MPFKFDSDKLLIPRDLDMRVKLSLDDREKIKFLYGKISQRKLAKMFDVSRSSIIFIGDPEKHKRNLLCRKLRGGSKQYYVKDKQRVETRLYRRRKKLLFDEGLLDVVK